VSSRSGGWDGHNVTRAWCLTRVEAAPILKGGITCICNAVRARNDVTHSQVSRAGFLHDVMNKEVTLPCTGSPVAASIGAVRVSSAAILRKGGVGNLPSTFQVFRTSFLKAVWISHV
jgi:hypothetical protein